jgi:thiol-disulfide isomerase/thioredoxin
VGLHGRFDGSAVLFALPGCAICQSIAPDANGLAAAWPSIEFVWIDRELPQPPEEAQADFLAGWRIGLSEDESAFKDFDVAGVPFFYVIGRDGIIAAKKLVNAVEDIQRLVKSVYGPELAEKAEIGHALGGYDD